MLQNKCGRKGCAAKKTPDPANMSERQVGRNQQMCEEASVNLVVVNDELTPAQKRNIEQEMDIKVIDRTQVILDILPKGLRREGKLRWNWRN